MNSGQSPDEELLWITALYVAELRAGLRPLLSAYITRYPQYAEAIADFVIYYHTIEVELESLQADTAAISPSSAWREPPLLEPRGAPFTRVAELPQAYASDLPQSMLHVELYSAEQSEQVSSIRKQEDPC